MFLTIWHGEQASISSKTCSGLLHGAGDRGSFQDINGLCSDLVRRCPVNVRIHLARLRNVAGIGAVADVGRRIESGEDDAEEKRSDQVHLESFSSLLDF